MPTTPFTPEHQALRDTVRRLVERELVDAAAEAEAGGTPHAAVLDRCVALGLLETGDILAQVAGLGELARAPSAGLVAVLTDAMLGVELLGDVALTAVVDRAALDVDEATVTGEIPFAVGGQVAARCVVPGGGLRVDAGRGWSAKALPRPHALRGGAVADVILAGAACGALEVTPQALARHDLRQAAAAVAASWATWEQARRYAGEREAFGRPIGRFQVNRHTLARTASKLTAAESLVHDTAWLVSRGATTAAGARRYAAAVGLEVADAALQLHGGYGYTTEFDVERAWRDAHWLVVGGAHAPGRQQQGAPA